MNLDWIWIYHFVCSSPFLETFLLVSRSAAMCHAKQRTSKLGDTCLATTTLHVSVEGRSICYFNRKFACRCRRWRQRRRWRRVWDTNFPYARPTISRLNSISEPTTQHMDERSIRRRWVYIRGNWRAVSRCEILPHDRNGSETNSRGHGEQCFKIIRWSDEWARVRKPKNVSISGCADTMHVANTNLL